MYLGRSPGGRLVAVKVIRDEISDHPEALTRFRREAASDDRGDWTVVLYHVEGGPSTYTSLVCDGFHA
ncbi:hypothetical protein [Kitasatospora cinereorecta]